MQSDRQGAILHAGAGKGGGGGSCYKCLTNGMPRERGCTRGAHIKICKTTMMWEKCSPLYIKTMRTRAPANLTRVTKGRSGTGGGGGGGGAAEAKKEEKKEESEEEEDEVSPFQKHHFTLGHALPLMQHCLSRCGRLLVAVETGWGCSGGSEWQRWVGWGGEERKGQRGKDFGLSRHRGLCGKIDVETQYVETGPAAATAKS